MAAKRGRSEIEETVYRLLRWLKKWDLRDVDIYTRESCFCLPSESDGAGPWTARWRDIILRPGPGPWTRVRPGPGSWARGWRDLEEVWVSPRGEAFARDFAEDGRSGGAYTADFDLLPGEAQDIVLRLLEERADWYCFQACEPLQDEDFGGEMRDLILGEYRAILAANRSSSRYNDMGVMRVYAD